MTRDRKGRSRRARLLGVVWAAALLLSTPAWSSEDVSLRIIGISNPTEGKPAYYRAILEGRVPMKRGSEGYQPQVLSSPSSGAFVPMQWEAPIEYVWHFDDGTEPISTGSLPNVTHRFFDDTAGEEIAIAVVAKIKDLDWLVSASKQIVVKNRDPTPGFAGAIEIDPATSTFELTAAAMDAAGDREELTYEWDFGDGEKGEGEKVTHRYILPGTYEAKVTVRDGDGGETEWDVKVVVDATGDDADPVEEGSPPADVGLATGFEGTVGGFVSGKVEAEIRPFAGLFLSQIGNGICRLVWTGWDPKHLGIMTFIADLPYLPEEGAVWSNLRLKVLQLAYKPDGEDWLESYGAANRSALGLGAVGWAAARERLGEMGDEESEAFLEDEQERSEHEDTVNEVLTDVGAGFRVGARERQRFAGPPVARSPFGFTDNPGFEAEGATVKFSIIPHEYAKAELEGVSLVGEDGDGNQRSVTLSGTFFLDLEAAQSDGIVRYDGCAPRPTFAVRDEYPTDGARNEDRHLRWVEVSFNRDYDPDTLDEDTFQITYRPPGERSEPVVVPSRFVRRSRYARLYPKEPLFSGVRYTARVKTGEDGVKGPGGSELEDTNGKGWLTWQFWTQVDPATEPGGATRLGCQIHQSVRGAPLIMEKPAVARLYLEWARDERVHPDDQVDAVSARIPWKIGGETIEVSHTFLRKDLDTPERKRLAENTANVFWTPKQGHSEYPSAVLEVEEVMQGTYSTICHAPAWDHQPTLTIDYYVLAINSWEDEAALGQGVQLVQKVMQKSRELSEQLFPFHRVEARYRGIIRPPESEQSRLDLGFKRLTFNWRGLAEEQDPALEHRGDDSWVCIQKEVPVNDEMTGRCPQRLLGSRYVVDGEANILIGFQPGKGGGAHQRIGDTDGFPEAVGLGVLTFGAAAEFDRLAEVVPHEIGHTLGLEHLPLLSDGDDGVDEREDLQDRLIASLANDRDVLHWYQGIEGFRIESSGTSGYNKSSEEGNGESDWLVPIMYPIAIQTPDVWITRHHYFDVMDLVENSPSVFK